jgi:hypothetical protein
MSARSVSIRPYLARRPRSVTRAPVMRCLRSGGKGGAQVGPARLHKGQYLALQHGAQSGNGGFDFGKLWA